MRVKITTTQEFEVVYVVDADTPREAWGLLLVGHGENLEQLPGRISGSFKDAQIESNG